MTVAVLKAEKSVAIITGMTKERSSVLRSLQATAAGHSKNRQANT